MVVACVKVARTVVGACVVVVACMVVVIHSAFECGGGGSRVVVVVGQICRLSALFVGESLYSGWVRMMKR